MCVYIIQIYLSIYLWNTWFVVWNITFIFAYIGNVIIPIDFHIFQRGRYTTNQYILVIQFMLRYPTGKIHVDMWHVLFRLVHRRIQTISCTLISRKQTLYIRFWVAYTVSLAAYVTDVYHICVAAEGHHIRNAPTMFLPGRMAFEFDTELELLGPPKWVNRWGDWDLGHGIRECSHCLDELTSIEHGHL